MCMCIAIYVSRLHPSLPVSTSNMKCLVHSLKCRTIIYIYSTIQRFWGVRNWSVDVQTHLVQSARHETQVVSSVFEYRVQEDVVDMTSQGQDHKYGRWQTENNLSKVRWILQYRPRRWIEKITQVHDFTLHQHYQASKIKDTQFGGACGMHRGDEKCIKISQREPKGKRPFWKPDYRW